MATEFFTALYDIKKQKNWVYSRFNYKNRYRGNAMDLDVLNDVKPLGKKSKVLQMWQEKPQKNKM